MEVAPLPEGQGRRPPPAPPRPGVCGMLRCVSRAQPTPFARAQKRAGQGRIPDASRLRSLVAHERLRASGASSQVQIAFVGTSSDASVATQPRAAGLRTAVHASEDLGLARLHDLGVGLFDMVVAAQVQKAVNEKQADLLLGKRRAELRASGGWATSGAMMTSPQLVDGHALAPAAMADRSSLYAVALEGQHVGGAFLAPVVARSGAAMASSVDEADGRPRCLQGSLLAREHVAGPARAAAASPGPLCGSRS